MSIENYSASWCESATQPLQVFCFPYAGGSARTIYGEWEDELHFNARVIPVDLPGRGAKAGQAVSSDLGEVAAQLAAEIAERATGKFVFYGHSVGALVCYEVACQLSSRYGKEPDAIFVGAFRAPHTPSRRKPVHGLSDPELLDHVSRLGGVPADLLAEPELLRLTMPVLRADLRLSEAYQLGERAALRSPIYAYGGDADPIVAADELLPWGELTSGKFEVSILKGGHFFHEISQSALFEDFSDKTIPLRVS